MANGAMIPMRSAADVDNEKRESALAIEEAVNGSSHEEVIDGLSMYVDRLWQKARDAKRNVEDRFLAALRARNGEYEPSKLAAMQQMFGPTYTPVFMHITETKCRTAESWITETIFQTGKPPFSVEPTPIPELPPGLAAKVKQEAMMALVQAASREMEMLGGMPDMYKIMSVMQAAMPEVNEAVMKNIREIAKEASLLMQDKIQDQFVEGNWYNAVQRAIYDFVTFGTMVIKGPCLRKSPIRIREYNDATGMWDDRVEERIIPVWERRSPFDIYPSPDATAVDDGWIFDKIQLTRRSLSDLKGVPGYDEEKINEVLKTYRNGGLRDWTSIDSDKIAAEGKSYSTQMDSETIECLEFHGSVPGSMLLEWGMSSSEVSDSEREYDVILWKIGQFVIKAMLNPDPLRKKYFYRAGFSENPDSFWGKGVFDLIEHIQTLANSIARAIAQNVAIASGPQVEVNVDRLAPGENEAIYPWKVWKVTNQGMQEGRAVEFFSPNLVTQRLIEAYNFCMALADEDSGVPRYMQGNGTSMSGAGETSSGLSMLMSHAAKGVRSAIRNIDIGVISPSVEGCYYYNMEYEKDLEVIGDLRFVARASSSLIAKQEQQIRRTEFLNTTANPVDMQIIGLSGRRELLKESVRGLDLDPDKILGDDRDAEDNMMQAPPSPAAEVAPAISPASGLGGSPKKNPMSTGPDGAEMGGERAPQFQNGGGVKP